MARAPEADAATPEADRAPPAPHPRQTEELFGQQSAERAFLDAFNSGRLHHGWLITGPRGVGKATLAWRIARFLLSAPEPGGLFAAPAATTLAIEDETLTRRILALSEPRLFLLRRPWDEKAGRLRAEIPVDEVRRLKAFFNLSSADGGRRIVIVDAAEEMNISAANALLKVLEEPPKGVVMLLVSHQPSRLLPTIRSRCRELRLSPLDGADMRRAMEAAGLAPAEGGAALALLSGGSVGEAIRLSSQEGQALYAELVRLFSAPRADRAAMIALAESCATRGAEERFAVLVDLIDRLLARAAMTGATGSTLSEAVAGEAALLGRLAPDAAAARDWADLQLRLGARAREGRLVNLDAGALALDLLLRVAGAAALR